MAAAVLEIFTSGSANQPLDDAHDLPEAWPPTPAVRTKRALRSAPVVLMRGVRMPTYAETGASIVIWHSLRILPVRRAGEVGEQLKAIQLQMMPRYRFVAGRRFQVPAGPGGGPLGIEPERPGSGAVSACFTTCSAAARRSCSHAAASGRYGRVGQHRGAVARKIAGPAYGMAVARCSARAMSMIASSWVPASPGGSWPKRSPSPRAPRPDPRPGHRAGGRGPAARRPGHRHQEYRCVAQSRDDADAAQRMAIRHHLPWHELDALTAQTALDQAEGTSNGWAAKAGICTPSWPHPASTPTPWRPLNN